MLETIKQLLILAKKSNKIWIIPLIFVLILFFIIAFSNIIFITGIACLLNTSFNLKGEPIVENPQQAVEDFLRTKMDYLVIGEFLVWKTH
ncbi:MAG: carbamoyltransferase C-terminal domain-containing protein [Microgenomates group bacterium]